MVGGPGGPNGPGGPGAPGAPGGPGAPGTPGAPGQAVRGTPQQDAKPAPIGAGSSADKSKPVGTQGSEPKSSSQPPAQPAPPGAAAPTPPVDSKPTAAEVKATANSLSKSPAAAPPANGNAKSAPAGPKNNRVTPVVPITSAISSKAGPQATAAAAAVKSNAEPTNGSNAASLKDATQAAKEAVAVAMAKLNNQAGPIKTEGPASGVKDTSAGNANLMDNLTNKVNEMRVNAAAGGRGRGRGGRTRGPNKIDVPDSDFDFQTSNAKFNKQDLVKEAIAGGSPLGETANGAEAEAEEPEESVPVAYNKTKSFFDNISSESKDRAENGGQKPGGREWRGEEQRKNMETFGQGSVDGGFRGGYRGRGRGRGRGGRGYGPRTRGGFRQPTTQ